jgi:hypothetical protein
MDMIAGDHVIQHRKTEALFDFEYPAQITAPIARELQEKPLLMAAVSDVPYVDRAENGGWRAASVLRAPNLGPKTRR